MPGKLVSKWFRVAVEGKTVDGRIIAKHRIQEMAKSYNRDVYGARVWVEHLRGWLADSQFSAKGDVLELKAEEIAEGELAGKFALFAKIQPLQELADMVNAGKKIFTSIEIQPEFPTTGEAYMVGLAVTDEPASIGTEVLEFSAKKRGEDANLLSVQTEVELEFEEIPDEESEDKTPIMERVKALFSRSKQDAAAVNEDVAEAIEEVAGEVVELEQKFSERVGGKVDKKLFDDLSEKFNKLLEDFNGLKADLDNTEKKTSFKREPSTGEDRAKAKY